MTETRAATRDDLLALLDRLDVAHETVDHPAIFTVDQGRDMKASMPGGHSKNLCLKDKKGALYLAVAWCDTRVDLVALGKRLGAKGRLSFARPELMTATLGVEPGSVTPFALMNETARALSRVVLDEALTGFERIWFHPLENTASTSLAPLDLMRFMGHYGFAAEIVDLSAPLANGTDAAPDEGGAIPGGPRG